MAATGRRSWDSLTPTYRGRLQRQGVTRGQYESGASLAGARGHARTPERPARADRKSEYAAYRAHRSKPMRVVTPDGVQVLSGLTAADRSTVGKHSNAISYFLNFGRSFSRLSKFDGVTVTGYTADDDYLTPMVVTLLTDFTRLEAMAQSGQLDYKEVYEKAA